MIPDSVPRWSVLPVMLVLLMLVIPSSATATWTPERISPTEPEPIAADISGQYVVYTVAYGEAINLSAPRGLLLYNDNTGRTFSLAVSSGEMTLTGGQISGDAVVWFEEPQIFSGDASGPRVNNSVLLSSVFDDPPTPIRESPSAEWPKTDGRRVIWSETDEDTYISTITLYDIASQTTDVLPVHPDDGSTVVFDGDTIAFRDGHTFALSLYDIPSNTTTVVMTPLRTNTTRTAVDEYAMGGDCLLYKTRHIDLAPTRGIYSTLARYDRSTNTTTLISPVTGKPVETLTEGEKTAAFDSLFTDGATYGWSYETGISASDLITVDAATGAVSHLTINGDVAFPAIDGNRAVWVESKMLNNSRLVLATWHGSPQGEDATTPTATPAPLCGLLGGVGALAVLACRRTK